MTKEQPETDANEQEQVAALEETAYHEAGHAVAAYVLRRRFSKASIVREEDSLGRLTRPPSYGTGFEPELDYKGTSKPWIEQEIMSLLAAGTAVDLLTGREDWGEGEVESSDLQKAHVLAEMVCGSNEEVEAYLNWLAIRTRNMLSNPPYWAAVEALAGALLEQQEIGYRKARKIIGDAMDAWKANRRK
jgi:ATP-dependent Zn protease